MQIAFHIAAGLGNATTSAITALAFVEFDLVGCCHGVAIVSVYAIVVVMTTAHEAKVDINFLPHVPFAS